jgi:hypothetical protein
MSETESPTPQTNGELRALVSAVGFGATGLEPKSLADIMAFAQLMAKAGPMVGKSFRGNPGACMGITMQAMRWGMDPFAVSQKAYTTGQGDDATIAYEAQLVNAVILASPVLKGRPTYLYEGEGEKRRCKVVAMLRADPEPKDYLSPPLASIRARSPLWKSDPDQQLAYYAIRSWARRHCPEIILGVYTVEEMETVEGSYERVPDAPGAEFDPRPFLGGRGKAKLRDKLVADLTTEMEGASSHAALTAAVERFKASWRVSENVMLGIDEVHARNAERIEEENAAAAHAEMDADYKATVG